MTDDFTAHNGIKSAKIIQSKASANADNVKVYYSTLQIEKNKTYTVAFWAKVDAREGSKRDVVLSVQTINPEPFLKTITLDSVDWKEYVNVFTFPKDIEGNMRISLFVGLSDVDFWIDDFRFFEGEPTDEIMIGETLVNPKNKMPISWGHIKRITD